MAKAAKAEGGQEAAKAANGLRLVTLASCAAEDDRRASGERPKFGACKLVVAYLDRDVVVVPTHFLK